MPEDRGELTSLMEPLLVGEESRFRSRVADLVLDLARKAAGFRRSLPGQRMAFAKSIGALANCCRRVCSRWRTTSQENVCASSPVNCAGGMSWSEIILSSVPEPCRAS